MNEYLRIKIKLLIFVVVILIIGLVCPVWAKPSSESEPNNRREQANELKMGESIKGLIQTKGDRDWYKLVVETSGKKIIRVDLSGVNEVDSRLEVYDASGKRLEIFNEGRKGEPEAIINFGVDKGEYYILVGAREMNDKDDYTLSTTLIGPWQGDTEFEPNNVKEFANELRLDKTTAGHAYPVRDRDWYSFTVPEPGMDILVIDQSGVPDVNTRLHLYDGKGQELKRVDSGSKGTGDRMVRMRVAAGRYYICVYCYGANPEKEYTLRVGKPDVQPAAPAEITQALTKALDYLASKQTKEGCWPGRYGKSTGIVGMGLMAYIGAECASKKYSTHIEAAVEYLKSQYHPSTKYPNGSKEAALQGGLIGKSDPMYSHGIATLSLIEALVELNDSSLEPMIQDALRLILRSQNTEHKPEILKGPIQPDSLQYGGWRYSPDSTDSDISVSGWQVLALKAAINAGFSVPDWSLKKAAHFIRACYDKKQNGFAYRAGTSDISCSRTGTGVLSLQLCGYPQDEKVPPALRFMQDNAPVWELESPGKGWPFYYWYYGTRAFMNVGGDDWRIWKAWMCRLLVDHQSDDGSWDMAQQEKRVGEIYTTSLGALILELCCGHRPIYMRRLGNLSVVLAEEAKAAAVPRTIELILDASNSMWGRIENKTKIDIAKEVLSSIIKGLPADVEVGLRIYGHQHSYQKQVCTDSQLVVPVGAINKELLIRKIKAITPRGMTPIAFSLQQAGKDLKDIKGEKVVILVSDGKESCKGDPVAAAQHLKEAGLGVKIHVVGFAIADKTTRKELRDIAGITDGKYFDADSAEELKSALSEAVRLTYVVKDAKGREVLHGFVGEDSRRLEIGTYRVILGTEPETVVDNVVIEQDKDTSIIIKREKTRLKMEVKRK